MQCLLIRILRCCQNWRDVKPLCFPVRDGVPRIKCLNTSYCFLQCSESQLCEILAYFLCDVFKKVDNEFWLPTKAFAQFRVLCSNTNRASVEVTHPHHHASTHHKRCCCKPKLFRAKQRSNNHVTSSFHLAISLHNDAVSQAVEQQCLLRLG